ncbi:leucine-rich repeat and iq domain-containing protein 4-like: PROVISIONAL [Gigaspora margarita]|uniref:Leucine-rich repeat and iq domain-containing protein 4-like: PROVISIONAL n=1 Tax=Gigaspora margarita TaxID=4874 RepID=A0A8H3WW74_GIGMA|nr:leucine-rich repeat and iq domain-containing protein 4-like: PROVISIONAL [Gigaspora margarita]
MPPKEKLGDQKLLPMQNKETIKKLFSTLSAFWEKFGRDEISSIHFGLLDRKEVIVVTLDRPKDSSLDFYLPSAFKDFPVIIDYGVVEPFHRSK